MKQIATPQKKFLKRVCACGCGESFEPVVEHQKYVQDSHRVRAFQQRKFDRAVDAEVARRLKIKAIEAGNGS